MVELLVPHTMVAVSHSVEYVGMILLKLRTNDEIFVPYHRLPQKL